MSDSSDKAKANLLNSMRMSKGEAPAAEEKQAAPAASKKPATKKKAAKKKAPAKKPAAKKAAASKGASGFSSRDGRASVAADGFESGARIWPD